MMLILLLVFLPFVLSQHSALDKMISLYYSGDVPKDDPRFRKFTIEKLWADNIQAQVTSPRYGTIRFSGARENMNAKLIYTISGRPWLTSVEKTCINTSICDITLNNELRADSGQTLTWEVRTDSLWPLGSHLLANGTFFWELEEGEKRDDVTASSVFDNVECSQATFVIASSSDVRDPDGKILYTQTNSQILFEGTKPACIALNFTVPGTTFNKNAVWIKIEQTKTTYRQPLVKSDQFIYTWVPVGVTNLDKNQVWNIERSVQYSSIIHKASVQCFREKDSCGWLNNPNNWYGGTDSCDACNDIATKLSCCDALAKAGKSHLTNICSSDLNDWHGKCNVDTSPSLSSGSYRAEISCPNEDLGLDIMCRKHGMRKDKLQIPTSGDEDNKFIELMVHANANSGKEIGSKFNYEPWELDFLPTMIDAKRFIQFNNAPDAKVTCKSIGRDIYRKRDHVRYGSQKCTREGLCHARYSYWQSNTENLVVYFQNEYSVECTSKRLIPVKFYRSLEMNTVSRTMFRHFKISVYMLGVDEPKISNVALQVSGGNNGFEIDLGDGQNIKIISETDYQSTGVNYGLYEVKGEADSYYQVYVGGDSKILNFKTQNPFSKATHKCLPKGKDSISCQIYGNQIFDGSSTGDDFFTNEIRVKEGETGGTLSEPTFKFIHANGVPIEMEETTPPVNKNLLLSGQFKFDILVDEIIPTECSVEILSGACNDIFFMNIGVKAAKNPGFVSIDHTDLIGVSAISMNVVQAGGQIVYTKVKGIANPGTNQGCKISGTLKLVGTDGASCSVPVTKTLAVLDAIQITPFPSATPAPVWIDTNRPTTPGPTAPTEPESGGSSNLTLIIGLVVGALFLVGGGLVLYFFMLEDTDEESSGKVDTNYII